MSESPSLGKRISKDKIKFTANIDLNALFNLNYNFDLLKGIIEELLNNQQILQDQMDKVQEKSDAKDERIEKLEREVKELRENQVDKKLIEKILQDLDEIKNRLAIHDRQIEERKKKYLFFYNLNDSLLENQGFAE